jgi:hypothetical protein
MSGLSRRMFLKQGSMTMAAAGAVAALPGLPLLLNAAESDAPVAAPVAESAGAEPAPLTETLVAHVKDLQTGEMSLFMGEREVVFHDPNLAALLHQAAR